MSVIYVTGAMRSGTTITGQMLAESPSTVLVGEVRPVLLEPQRHAHCDCGQPRETCPFWSTVDAALPADFDHAIESRALRLVAFPRLLSHILFRVRLPDYLQHAVAFLRAVSAAAGDRVIVDTTKGPSGILLWRLAGLELHLVQCWRSPRKVARAQARPPSESGLVQVPKPRSYAEWSAYNGITVLLRPAASSYTPVRYERLLRAPRSYAERVWGRSGAAVPQPSSGPQFFWSESHVLAGNPRRTKSGSVTIGVGQGSPPR
jgi:hypothetical protein